MNTKLEVTPLGRYAIYLPGGGEGVLALGAVPRLRGHGLGKRFEGARFFACCWSATVKGRVSHEGCEVVSQCNSRGDFGARFGIKSPKADRWLSPLMVLGVLGRASVPGRGIEGKYGDSWFKLDRSTSLLSSG